MRKFYSKIFTLLLLVCTAVITHAQTADQYGFSTSTGATLDPMTGATTIVSASTDDTPSGLQNIGFSFSFEGVAYTQFSASPDGFISLGSTAAASQFTNTTSSTTNIPKLYPLWDDLATGTGGYVSFVVTGTAPNRILKVEWFVTVPRNTGGAANTKFQAWLYETTNVIEFRYAGTPAGTLGSASVGIRGAQNSATAGAFKFVDVTTSAHTASNSTVNDANTAYPGAGRMYTFTPPPPCSGAPIAGLANASPTSVCVGGTASLSLTGTTSGVSGLTYQWQSSPNNSTWTDITGATSSTYTASVMANTWYRAVVGCSTSGLSQPSSSVQVTATGGATLPYNESFESITTAGTLPTCMSASPAVSTTGKTRTYIAAATGTNSALIARTGSKFAAVYWSPSNASGYFFTPALQLTAGVSYDASVWYKTDGVAWTDATIYYGTAPTVAAMTNTIATVSNAAATTYTQIKGSFIPPTTGTYFIAIRGFNATSAPNYIAFDDLSVDVTPACAAPSTVTISNITNSSASVSFVSTGNNFVVEYGPTGFTPGTGATAGTGGTVVTGTASPIALTGLAANTTYQVYVRQNCSGSYGPNSNVVSFTTPCAPIPTPLFEGFNTSGTAVFPTCWTQQYVTGTSNITFQTNSNNPTTTPYEGTRYVYWNSFSIGSGNSTRLVSPPLNTTGNANVNVEFYMFNENSANYTTLLEGVQVQYSLDGNTWVDAGTFYPRQDVSLAVGTGQWQKKSLTLPAAAGNQAFVYVGFKFVSQFGDNVSIDAVTIGCTPPTITSTTPGSRCGPGVVALSATASAGTINWYTSATSNTPVGTGAFFVTPVLNATTTYYVSSTNVCESPRTAVLAVVTPGPTFTVTPNTTICNGAIKQLTVTSPQSNFNTYTWSPAAGLYTDAAATIPYVAGSSATTVYMKQTTGGTYTYIANANNSTTSCSGIDSTKITVLPASVTLSASQSQICVSGSTVITSLTSGFGAATFQWYNSPNGTTYTPITGATAAFYTTPTLTATTYYRLDVKDAAGNVCQQPTITITVNSPQVTATTPAAQCGPGSLTLQATGSAGTTLNWYTSATGGAPVGTGTSFTTPNLTTTTTYYVGAMSGATTFNVGLASDVPANLASLGGYGMYFSSTSAATINTVDIYPSTAGTLNVTLRNAANTIVDTRTFTITAGDISNTVKKTLNLGFSVPSGATGWQIYYDLAIYRGQGTYTYPSTSNGFTITGNTLDGNNITSGTRYYFYNWNVTTGCESPRVAVAATINVNTAITLQPQSQTACAGANVLFAVTANGGNLTYQWRFNGAPIGGAVSPTYTINNVQTSNAGNYDVVVTGMCGTVTSTAAVLTVNATNTWLGTVSTDWNTASNWCGNVPTTTSDVLIPSGTPYMPSVTGTSEARNVTINSGATVTVAAGGRLDIYGNFTNNGTLNAGSGIIAFRGPANQTVGAISAGTILMNGNGGVTLSGNMAATTALVLTNGNVTLGSNNLTVTGNTPGSVTSHIITNGTGSVISNNITANPIIVPVGPDAASYNPVTIANGQGMNYTVRVATGINPAINDASRAINRTWFVSPSASVSSGVQLTYQYDDTHKNANAVPTNPMEVGVHNGTNWNIVSGSGGITPIGTATARQVTVTTTLFGPTVMANLGGVSVLTAIPNIDIDIAGVTLMPNVVNGSNTVMRVNVRRAMRIDWTVIDAKGRVVMAFAKQYQAGQNDMTLDLSRLSGGTYFITGFTQKGKTPLVRFIKM